ncbi:hypothetical protein SFC07_05305 [Corynebacterium callunae]|uniref:hypothetical protein n=1 Tax=Corynebacterium callunae TaxID=1721 RepID=UPI003981E24F
MSSIEAKYQLKPYGRAKLWWAICGVAAILLLLPVLINAVVPDKGGDYKPLAIDYQGLDWSVPITTESGAPVMCEEVSDEIFMKFWECNGDTTVVTIMVENVEDPANTLRRMTDAALTISVPADTEAIASDDDTAHAMYYEPAAADNYMQLMPVLALSQQGTGDYEDYTAIAIIKGSSLDYYGNSIWSSMAQQRGLDYLQELPVDTSLGLGDSKMLPGGELPFDLEEELKNFLEQQSEPLGSGA